uniref:PDZ domain containing ring finger 3 n=1 Tax=Lepisosteus oculatus TaxID=7918 RepID=W5LZE6_LEPOC
MGLDVELFVDSVDPDFRCRLCTKVLEDPMSTPCGHVFCAGCILPWSVKQRQCPLYCKPISAKELHQVLPLKNLIEKLIIRCLYHSRGCIKKVKVQDLGYHTEMCDYSPSRCRNKGCNEVLSLKDMDTHMRESCDCRPVEMCQNGCGLLLLHKDIVHGNHCCLNALRAQSGALQVKSANVEQAAKRQGIRLARRENSLLARVSALQNEVHLTALTYQMRFNRYKIYINNLSKHVTGRCKGGELQRLSIALHREKDSLGFNIIGGILLQEESTPEGIYVSKILERAPADKAGLQLHDQIIEVGPSLPCCNCTNSSSCLLTVDVSKFTLVLV